MESEHRQRRQLSAETINLHTLNDLMAAQIDINGADIVQIQTDASRVWVNVNGICVLRIYGVKTIEVDAVQFDKRAVPKEALILQSGVLCVGDKLQAEILDGVIVALHHTK